uniref:Reverse transcriptase domain-containing protein n=1 Tax=Plectus sambesii TaxID=2011161 RepID=A0A914XHK9_9BILA
MNKDMNSFFCKGCTRRWSWQSPNNQTFNEIDLLLMPDRRYISNVNVLAKFDAGSDHRLLQASFNYIARRTDAPSRPACKPPPEFNQLALKLEAAISLLKSPCPTPAREYARLVDALTHAARAAKEDVQLPTRISATNRALFHRRRQLRFGLANTPHAAIQYAELNKTLRKALATDLHAHHLHILEQAVAANRLRRARSQLATGRTQVVHLRRRDGQHTTTTAEAAALIRTFYNNLYRSANGPFIYTPSSSVTWAKPLSSNEVFQALAQLKSQRAAGPDRVLPLAAKLAAPHLALPLCSLFNDMLADDVIPPTLTAARTILLTRKSLTKVITWRIEAAVESRLPPNQAGFRKGYSTLDHLHAVNMAVEKCRKYNLRLSMLFVDFQKAFDTIEFRAIWNLLAHYGVDSSIIEIVKKLYASSSSIVTFASSEVAIDVQRGVQQGDTLSPKLFILCLQHALDSQYQLGAMRSKGRRPAPPIPRLR